MNQLKIEYVDLDKLKPFVDNPRNHSERNVDDILQSMKRFGWTNPIIARRDDNMVIAGHGRIEAARLNGTEQVPVIFTDFTENDAKLYSLTDNRTSETSDWDLVALNDLVKELDEMPDIDLDDSGFTSEELDDLLADVSVDLDKYADKDADAVPDVPETAQTQTGDIWHLGPHRVLCGDATKQDDVERLMDGNKADMVFTDPPYGINLDTDFSGMVSKPEIFKEKNIKGGKKYRPVIGDDVSFDPTFLLDYFSYCSEQFWWGGDYYPEFLSKAGSWFVWDKRVDESADKMYGSCFELCWSKTKHKREIARVRWYGVFGTEKEFDHKRHHPTQKPTALALWFFSRYKSTLIADPFLGSGTTLLASEKTGRQCYGMEIDPHYCDVIARRYVDFVGTHADAWLERDGQRTHYSEMFDVLPVQIPTTDGSSALSEAAI